MDPPSPPSPSSPKVQGPRLFGRDVLWRSNTQSPSSQYSTPVMHHKPRLVKQASKDDENSTSEVLEIVETTPSSDPKEQASQNTQVLEQSHPPPSPAQHTRSQSSNAQSTPRAARVTVIPKKNLTTVRTVTEQTNNKDEDMDGTYEDTRMVEEYNNANEDEDDEEAAEDEDQDGSSQEGDPLPTITDDYYTAPRTKGKGALGKRAKGKAYFVGGKSPRGVGGKAPRNPTGAGKAPAISPKEKQDQRRRVIHLNESPSNNNTTKKATRKKKKKIELLTMPVGTKPKATNGDGPRKRKSRWKEQVIRYQRSTGFMIPKKRFQNLVREIVHDDLMESFKWARTALEALQWAAEQWVTEHLDLTNLCAIHGKRVTIMKKDSGLVRLIQQNVHRLRDSIISRI